ncbi:MAG: DNA primase, partial [Rhodospirillales bacterium]|nr:DNA primase [Rhodospirillales bacterium]
MNATRIAKALGERAEEVCRAYLPHGRRQGRYWVAGDLDGARGRSLFVRLAPPGARGKWTDAAEGTHSDLLDIIRHRMGGVPLRDAMAEARAFLALPAAPASGSADAYDPGEAARRLWRRCRAIDGTHAEAYLKARAIHRCRFPALRFHPSLFYRDGGGVRRLPALVAAVTAGAREHPGSQEPSGPGDCPEHAAIVGVHRTWLDPSRPAKAAVSFPRKTLGRVHGHAVRIGEPAAGTLVVGEGIETVLSLVTAVPSITAAAALSAGSLGAFTPPPGI